jgi:glycosyltransferase involved in cell wall biosynthesis
VATVAISCCRQAALAGHDVSLVVMTPSTRRIGSVPDVKVESLGVTDLSKAPLHLWEWSKTYSPDFMFLNGCREIAPAIPHLNSNTRLISVAHDTANWAVRLACEHNEFLDAIAAVSDYVAARVQARLGNRKSVTVLHNGSWFPTDGLKNEAQRCSDIVFMGGSNPKKGANDLLRIWRLLCEAGFDGCLQWIGEIDPFLRKKIDLLPCSSRIELRGLLPRREVFNLLGECKALLMLSAVDAFGMVTVEAMGMGCVPVAWDVESGTREIIESGKNGILVPHGKYRLFAQVTMETLQNHDVLSHSASARARGYFSEEQMWQRYWSLICEVGQKAKKERPLSGTAPPNYKPPRTFRSLLPKRVERFATGIVNQSPKLSRALRNYRGG